MRALLLTCGAVAACLLLTSACTEEGELEAARASYNDALREYQGERWQEAADGFLKSRDQARFDPELRYRAAFNLGMSHARVAEATMQESPQDAIESLRTSASWFQDAVRRRPEDEDARVNLEIVLRRAQLLADQLNQGTNSLEARLDRVIEDQRSLLDAIRKLLARVEQAGAGAEPVGFEPEFDELATFERTLLADTGVIADLAGDELDLLQNKPEEERSDQDRMRTVQLGNLDQYLQRARASIADTRRLMRRLQGDKAHGRADAALTDLKRAREQLLDPVAVLKGISEDQSVLFMHTGGLLELGRGTIKLDGDVPAKAPPWLTSGHLGDRQQGLKERTAEILARFSAGVGSAEEDQSKVPDDPRSKRMLEAAREALPHLQQAVAEMEGASAALAGNELTDAAQKQAAALEALFRAIERFAALRDLIELTYRDQVQIVALLTPPGATPDDSLAAQVAADPKLGALSTDERAQALNELLGRNRERLERLKGLLEDELAVIEKQAQEAQAQQQQQAASDPDAGAAAPDQPAAEKLEAARERFRIAEELRTKALGALVDLGAALDAPRKRTAAPEDGPLAPATTALEHIKELRRLFFSIIEHLKELHRSQTDTHDDTATAHAADDDERTNLLGPLADYQQRHAAFGEAIAAALEEQADATAASTDPKAQEATEALTQAAVEVRDAHSEMTDAASTLAEARDQAISYDLQPALDHQSKAIEHLANAINILEPQSQQDQQQDQQQQSEDSEQVSQQQAQRRLQAIRDREQERERKRRDQERTKPDPVEKDW